MPHSLFPYSIMARAMLRSSFRGISLLSSIGTAKQRRIRHILEAA